jgi:GT2 family glycosyltransferase/glycosyltransferase involved in cell wall biosynthesis
MKKVVRLLLRPIWHRRHVILGNIRGLFDWLFSTLDKIPLPVKLKNLIKDLTFLAVLHLIVQSKRFQQWRLNFTNTSHLQYILTQSNDSDEDYVPNIPAPSPEAWAELKQNMQALEAAIIDVIVPVYSGYEQSLNAVYCALATRKHNHTPYNVIVIDDASPDAALSASLRQLAKDGLFELHVNAQNLGFVQTVNKGMMLNPANEVILLNADTEVYNNWLDRMVSAAKSDSTISTLTPLSNNAEICSYPYFVQNNQRELELPYAELDEIFASTNGGKIVDVPTGVGFCMYISRASLNDVGLFDVEHFGKGYGEENDFCRRAANNGWRNVALCDTFVRHIGGTSFGKSKQKRCRKAYEVLVGLHPDYPKAVADFVTQDIMRPQRRAVDIERINLANKNTKTILMINHQMGGGTERNVRELCESLANENIGHVVLEPSYLGTGMVVLKHYKAMHTVNLVFSMEYDRDELIATLRQINVFHVHVHHVINFPPRTLNLISIINRELDLQYDVSIHDYFSICPRINLIDDDNQYCGEPEVKDCESCIQRNHSHAAGASVWQWRDNFETLLMQARNVFAPDADVAKRINRYYRHLQVTLRPHAEIFDAEDKVIATAKPRLKIGVVGAISGMKGSKIMLNLVRDANERELEIEYVVIGYSDRSDLHDGLERYSVTGKYEEAELRDLLVQHQPDVIFIPTPIPETYCYTLSIAWRFGLMPIVFDIGAQAARIRQIGKGAGKIIPLDLAHDASRLNDWFLENIEAQHCAPIISPENVLYNSIMIDYYGLKAEKPKAVKRKKEIVASEELRV